MPPIPRPRADEHAPYYARYIDQVPEGDLIATLRASATELQSLLAGLRAGEGDFRYAPGKWSIKDVVQHVSDTERIFAYRLLRIARGDTTPLAGFDQDPYVATADAGRRSIAELVEEHAAVREATIQLLRQLDDAALARAGTASENPVTARALAWIIAGHERHHLNILRTRYLDRANAGAR